MVLGSAPMLTHGSFCCAEASPPRCGCVWWHCFTLEAGTLSLQQWLLCPFPCGAVVCSSRAAPCLVHAARLGALAHCLFARVQFRQVSSSHGSSGPCSSFHTSLRQHAYQVRQAQLTSGSQLLHPTTRWCCVLAWFGTSLAHAQAALVIACCRFSVFPLLGHSSCRFLVAFCSSKRPRHSTPHAVQQ